MTALTFFAGVAGVTTGLAFIFFQEWWQARKKIARLEAPEKTTMVTGEIVLTPQKDGHVSIAVAPHPQGYPLRSIELSPETIGRLKVLSDESAAKWTVN